MLSILLSAAIILLGLRKSTSAPISRKLLQSFSDQQILTGIGIQSVGLAKMKTMVPYHFFIIWLLSLLSTATNLATLLALVNDFKRDWVLRWIRQLLMLINMFLGILSGIFILQTVMKNMEPRLPIACVWQVESKGTGSNAALSIAGTIAVIAGQVLTFGFATWYLHNRSNPKWLKTVQVHGRRRYDSRSLGISGFWYTTEICAFGWSVRRQLEFWSTAAIVAVGAAGD
jgi:hypothetical protein